MEITHKLLSQLTSLVANINNSPAISKIDIYELMGEYATELILSDAVKNDQKPHTVKVYGIINNINVSLLSATDINKKHSIFTVDKDVVALSQMMYHRMAVLIEENGISVEEFIEYHSAKIYEFYSKDPFYKPKCFLSEKEVLDTLSTNRDYLVFSVVSLSLSFLKTTRMIESAKNNESKKA